MLGFPKSIKLETLLTVSVFIATSTASSATLIRNGGFEQPLWVFQSGAGIVQASPGVPGCENATHSGSYAAFVNSLGSDPPGYGSVSQTVPTVPGQLYEVTFWAAGNCVANGDLTASFAGTSIDLSTLGPNTPYTKFQFTATATSSTSTFAFYNTFVSNGTYFLDDVSIVPKP